MNIAYIITRADSVGGATIHVRDLARAMLDRGHQVTVILGGRGVADGMHSVQMAVRAMARGAYDYLRKPFSATDLTRVVARGGRADQLGPGRGTGRPRAVGSAGRAAAGGGGDHYWI